MAGMDYLNFDLTFRARAGGGYRAEVNAPGGGEPKLDFDLPFTPEEIATFQDVPGGLLRDARRPQAERPQAEAQWRDKVKNFGGRLYETIFTDGIQASFDNCLSQVGSNKGLRIRLRLNEVPELASLPWEYLYNHGRQLYLSLSPQTPIVRYVALDTSPTALLVKPPLNALVMISDPKTPGLSRLAVEQEWTTICEAFQDLTQKGLVTVDRLQPATSDALLEFLRRKSYHVFHFIGHGAFEAATDDAALLMETANGEGDFVGKEYLTVLLNHPTLRLVILNSCDGARAGSTDPFSGVAQSLVQQGIPAVIAMQDKITDDAARLFAKAFFASIAEGLPVDASLTEARRGIFTKRNPTEWGTPVLFMRSPDGRIFQIDQPLAEQLRQARIEAYAKDAQVAIERKEYAVAVEKLQAIMALEKS
ncbi:MAG: CHAT domain-containing protein [Chloroflexi bacterium]|nr:CHAT domain-containing protein [Chloroflexota bacterium]